MSLKFDTKVLFLFLDHRQNRKMPEYKLTYFNIRARAEVTRMLFTLAGVEFEDKRIDFGSPDWPEFKPSISLRNQSHLISSFFGF